MTLYECPDNIVKQQSFGCEAGHPTQIHRRPCIVYDDKEHIDKYFDQL